MKLEPGDLVKRSARGAWLSGSRRHHNLGASGIVIAPWDESHEASWFWVMWQDGTVEKACNAWVEKVDEA